MLNGLALYTEIPAFERCGMSMKERVKAGRQNEKRQDYRYTKIILSGSFREV